MPQFLLCFTLKAHTDTQDFHALRVAYCQKDEWESPKLGRDFLTFSLQILPCLYWSKSHKWKDILHSVRNYVSHKLVDLKARKAHSQVGEMKVAGKFL